MVVRFHPTPQKLNDRMVRVYEGDALQMRLEKSTSGVRISLRSQKYIIDKMTKARPYTWKCEICNKVFRTRKLLYEHWEEYPDHHIITHKGEYYC